MLLPVTWIHSTLLLFFVTLQSLFSTGTVAGLNTKIYSFNASSAFNYDTQGPVSFSANNVAVDWYDPAWQYRHKITISHEHVAETLTDFPVLIRLNETDVYTHARDDGHDLLFTSSDGVTKLSHEREDNTHLWVKVPTLSSTEETILYLYYGNPNATDQQNAAEVWTNGYASVYHLNEDPAGTINDSTKNNNSVASEGGMSVKDSLREGKTGNALHFDGSDDRLYGNHTTIEDEVTASIWINWQGGSDRRVLLNFMRPNDALWANINTFNTGTFDVFFRQAQASAPGYQSSNSTIPQNQWTNLAVTWDGATIKMYINGTQDKTIAAAGVISFNGASGFSIGRASWSNLFHFDGLIDNTSMSTIARNNNWIRAEYVNQCDCEDFLSISSAAETNSLSNAPTDSSTITLKPDRPLPFTSLSSFTPNASDTITYQLSNDTGKTWLFYTKDGWKGANPINTAHTSSANDINGHLSSFPVGEGQLLWRAHLPAQTTFDSLAITYTSGAPTASAASGPVTSLSHPVVVSINSFFRSVFTREIVHDEWLYWTNRILAGEKTTFPELLGAMQWQQLFGE